MKYWIFQNNQVLGPYEPDEMGKISVFSPESLVCPEGRRGTSMGDWQRAGMVPDLSLALVRASASTGGKTSTLSIAGLPPEPTLKDLAQLGSIQEKVASLEDVVLQLQEGLRAKDAELDSVHQELAGKSREATEIRNEAVSRQREADELRRQLSGLEERLTTVRSMSETLDKAVEEEKRVEQDVEKQGRTLTDLAKDVSELRRQLAESKSRPPDLSAGGFPVSKPLPAVQDISKPAQSAPSAPPSASPVPVPLTIDAPPKADPIPSFDSSMPSMPESAPSPSFDPMSYGGPSAGSLAPDPAPSPMPEPEPESVGVLAPPPPPPAKGKKALLIGAVAGLAALGGLAVMGGYVPGMRKPKAPPEVVEAAPLPAPEPVEIAPPPPDPRQLAVEFAKSWPLPGDRTLERALEDLAPSAGNLSPWMADPLAGSRMQVNYFARSSAPGAPTIAYEFEVDLEGRTLIGRNAAAKSVLTGKAAAPPAPPKPKPVKVKPKPPVAKAPETDDLDSMLGDAAPKKGARAEPFGEGTTMTDTGDAPPDEGINEPGEEQPRKAKPGRRAAKAAKPAKPAPAADEALLDDLLME